ncbi:hypothetical protein LTS15_005562 [Exophiala xenobiotica]|nr:hypothetical protein LTS15_005562 [Exophiala xenobiotica]
MLSASTIYSGAGRKPREGLAPTQIKLMDVDLFNSGQLDDFFLTNINPKGQAGGSVHANALLEGKMDADSIRPLTLQVSELVSPVLKKPIADSLDITWYLLDRYPDLLPQEHEGNIRDLLKAVHALNYFALSFHDRPKVTASFVKNIQDRLARDDISDEYRKALEYKLSVTTQMKVHGIQPDAVRANEQKVRELMGRLEALLSSSLSSVKG